MLARFEIFNFKLNSNVLVSFATITKIYFGPYNNKKKSYLKKE